MLGYYKVFDVIVVKFCGDWFVIGDLGLMDVGGNVIYLGCEDDMMNVGGYCVFFFEVEDVMCQYLDIE